jgi:hypothetical protein
MNYRQISEFWSKMYDAWWASKSTEGTECFRLAMAIGLDYDTHRRRILLAHVWVAENAAWMIASLHKGGVALDATAAPPVRMGAKSDTLTTAIILCHESPQGESWVLLSPQEKAVWVNGTPLYTRLRVLRDRDELRFADGRRLFFSTEHLAQVVAFPDAAETMYCVRCRQALVPQTPAIQCPACRVWHHQREDLPCWTYAERCAMCEQITQLEAGFRWTPEAL